MKLLVVEDDKRLSDYLVKGLGENGHVVDVAADLGGTDRFGRHAAIGDVEHAAGSLPAHAGGSRARAP